MACLPNIVNINGKLSDEISSWETQNNLGNNLSSHGKHCGNWKNYAK